MYFGGTCPSYCHIFKTLHFFFFRRIRDILKRVEFIVWTINSKDFIEFLFLKLYHQVKFCINPSNLTLLDLKGTSQGHLGSSTSSVWNFRSSRRSPLKHVPTSSSLVSWSKICIQWGVVLCCVFSFICACTKLWCVGYRSDLSLLHSFLSHLDPCRLRGQDVK